MSMLYRLRWVIASFCIIVILDALIDMGKWALGRYTDAGIAFSYMVLLLGSALLACIIEFIHRYRRKHERRYEQYEHHNGLVWVRKDLKGKHWEPTLCADCDLYYPDTADNCVIAELLFGICKEYNIVVVPWECPKFMNKGVSNVR